MRKLAYLMTLLSVGCMAALLVFYNRNVTTEAYVKNERSYEAPVNLEAAAEPSAPEAQESGEALFASGADSSAEESVETAPVSPAVTVGSADFTPERLIFIGDDRTNAMYQAAVDDTDLDIRFVSTAGADLNWLNRSAFDTEYQYINSRTAVIIMLGISDMHRAEDYIRVLNEWGEVFPRDFGAHFYFDSVNPVDPGVFNNEEIETFNETVRAGLSENVTYIDTYSVLKEYGYETTDTLHYTEETTKALYDLFKVYFNWEEVE